MKPHVMVDIETLGTQAGCAILSLGAVRFDPEGANITLPIGVQSRAVTDEHFFYRTIELDSCLKAGLWMDGETLLWWRRVAPDALEALRSPTPEALTDVLKAFATWFLETDGANTCFWSHGACFDEPILSAAYHKAKLPEPWDYHYVRDTRTLFSLAFLDAGETNRMLKDTVGKLMPHHALTDAWAQARAVQEAYYRLRKGMGCL